MKMKRSTVIVLASVAIVGVLVVFLWNKIVVPVVGLRAMSLMIGAEKDRIQNHPNTIDAGAVIEACVDLLTNAAHADLLDRRTPGDSPQLPSVIRKLEAMNVFVASNGVEIQMSGGHFQSGYFFNRTPTNYSLWYGDESGTTNRELANIHRE